MKVSSEIDISFYEFLGKAITPYNICALVNYAYAKSANMLTAKNGFRATGIHPFDPEIFTDSDFAAADFLLRTKDAFQDGETSLNSQADQVQPGEVQLGEVQADDVQTVDEFNVVDSSMGVLSDTITIDQIDANEYYVIRSNGDIIIGPVSNQYSIITNPDEVDQSAANTALELPQPEHSMIIDDHHDQSAPVDTGVLADQTEPMDEQENVSPVETKKPDAKKKRNRRAVPEPDSEANPIKKGRWDRNARDSVPKLDSFLISPSSVARKLENRTDSRRKKTASRKEYAAELTSSPHRKKLIETTALKDIKNIQKTGRKRTGRKAKPPVSDVMDDILCFICGTVFSVSGNGKGWSKCLHCQEWFHTTCSTDFEKCYNCE